MSSLCLSQITNHYKVYKMEKIKEFLYEIKSLS